MLKHAACITGIALVMGLMSGLALPTEAGAKAQKGKASWYGKRFHGRKTASGERFNMNAYSAAHRTLPFGTTICVRNLRNGRSVAVRVNDRGPFTRGRVVDVSHRAASTLGMVGAGTAPVSLTVMGRKRKTGSKC